MKTLASSVTIFSSVTFIFYACSTQPIQKEQAASSSGSQGASAGQGNSSGQGGGGNHSGQAGQTEPSGGHGEAGTPAANAGEGGSAGQDPAGMGGATNTTKECPSGKGPLMVKLNSPKGVPYCMDRTEVTQGQYAEFLEAKNGDTSGQDTQCQTNLTYEPMLEDPKVDDNPYWLCPVSRWDPENHGSSPVVCIDACDAQAFCQWAGKRLCGKIGGGVQKIEGSDSKEEMAQMKDANLSQWYNACSQGGVYKYAYGNTFDKSKCEDDLFSPVEASSATCHGLEAPFDEILNLSGGRPEYEGVERESGLGVVRAYNNSSPESSHDCAVYNPSSYDQDASFRCCADL